MKPQTLIIIGLLVVIAALIWFWPSPTDESAAIYRDSLKVLKAEKAVISSRINSNLEASRTRAKSDSIKLAVSLKEIARLKVKASKAVEAIPVRVLEENPAVGQALSLLQNVIQDQETLIDTLQNQLAFERNVREQLVALHYDQAKIESQMSELKDQRIIALEKDLKRERRRGKLKAVLLPVVAIGALILGQAL